MRGFAEPKICGFPCAKLRPTGERAYGVDSAKFPVQTPSSLGGRARANI